MKIGIYGSHGYIGSEFIKQSKERGLDVVVLERGVEWYQFPPSSAIINCAAYVCKPSVDLNDWEKEKTLIGNLAFPASLAAACEIAQVPLMQISTGCLWFDESGTCGSRTIHKSYDETYPPDLTFDKFSGWYVGSKQLSEIVVGQYDKSWICRIRLPFDRYDNPRNYITKILQYPRIVDVRNSISHRGDFVSACLDMIEQRVPYGTYNITNPGAVWTNEIAAMLHKAGLKQQFEYWPYDDFVKTARKTPMSVCELDVSKLLSTGIKMRPVQEALEDSIKNWKMGLT